METTKFGQTFYEKEATIAYPDGCHCPDGSCDWCLVYYNGLPETYLIRAVDAVLKIL